MEPATQFTTKWYNRTWAPRALNHWERNLGIKRVAIQGWQLAVLILFILDKISPGKNPRIESRMARVEAGIDILQHDTGELLNKIDTLETNNARLHRLFSLSPIAFHCLDNQGRITEVNACWLALMGYTSEEVVGKEIFDFIVTEQQENARSRFFARINGNPIPPKEGERAYLTKEGQSIFVATEDADFRDSDGSLEILTAFIDITPRIKAEKELELLQQRLMLQDRLATMGELLGGVAHANRNQLAAASGFISLMRDAIGEEKELVAVLSAHLLEGIAVDEDLRQLEEKRGEISRYADGLYSVIRQMEEITTGILASTERQARGRQETRVISQIGRVMATLELIAKRSGARIIYDPGKLKNHHGIGLYPYAFVDLMANLVKNGAEACLDSQEKKEITITVRVVDEKIILSVADTGCGMDQSKINEILSGKGTTTKSEGTGIGYKMILGHVCSASGEIIITSRVGKGTEVVVEFPITYISEADSISFVPPIMPGKTTGNRIVMVVEDEAMNRLLIKRFLEQQGFTVIMYADYNAAVEGYQEMSKKPAVVIVDWELPNGKTGADVIRNISQRGGEKPRFVLYCGAEHDDPLLSQERVAFVSKPFTDRLVTVVVELTSDVA